MNAPIYHLPGVVKSREDRDDFEGPLDLILFLLSKNKMEIRDIKISQILEQYLAWMRQRREMDLEVASEFVAMASHLVYIKTKMLLAAGEEESVSEMEELIASLEAHKRHEEYEKIKAVVPKLALRYAVGQDYMPKPGEPLRHDKTYQYVHEGMELKRSIMGIMERNDSKMPPPIEAFQGIVGHEPYPVDKKVSELLHRLFSAGVSRFQQLFKGNRSRSEIVATFIAVLELCKARRILLAGTERDCTVTCVDGGEDVPEITADTY